MIKYINRIILVMLAGLGLLTTYNLSEAYVISNFLTAEGQKALDEENYAFFMPSRFYNDVLLMDFNFTENGSSFDIRIYEVARIMSDAEGIRVEDGIFLLIEQLSGPELAYTLDIEYVVDDDFSIEYIGKKQFSLPLYISLQSQTDRTILLKDDFLAEDELTYLEITEIHIYEDKELSFEIPVSIDFESFVIKDQIEDYLAANNNEAPVESFDDVSVTEYIRPVDTNNVIFRNLAIYVTLVITLTVVFFRYKNKRLGRKKATEGLQKDVTKINEKSR